MVLSKEMLILAPLIQTVYLCDAPNRPKFIELRRVTEAFTNDHSFSCIIEDVTSWYLKPKQWENGTRIKVIFNTKIMGEKIR